jgi:flagellar hook-associated protein 2
MATISSPGIGSGIDVSSIVSQLVALERAPLTQLQSTARTTQTKLSTYGTIASQVSALGDAAAKLGSSSGWNSVSATSSNTSAIGVTVSAGTAATSLTMEVSQLAKAQSAASSAVPTASAVGTGSMTIELGAWSGNSFTAGSATPVSITIEAGQDSLTEIAAKINDAGAGVSATVLKDASGERLLLRSKETGAENGFKISVTDDDGNNSDNNGLSRLGFDLASGSAMTQTQSGQNALATINNVSISSASNLLNDTLPGISIQLSQVTTSPVEINVTKDTETISANVQAFVSAYNTLNATLANATKYDSSTQTAGTLQGDSTATGLQNALRSMMRSVTGSSAYTRLSDVGIELQSDGSLKTDSTKFSSALSNLDELKSLFTITTGSSTTQGFGLKIKEFASALIDTGGRITNRTDALQSAIDRNTDDQERVTDRAARAEVRYLAQYNAMDANVAKLSALNSFITQQITLWNNA